MRPEDIARLSPLGTKHFNLLGRYRFDLSESVQRGKLRPLRTCTDAGEEYLIA